MLNKKEKLGANQYFKKIGNKSYLVHSNESVKKWSTKSSG